MILRPADGAATNPYGLTTRDYATLAAATSTPGGVIAKGQQSSDFKLSDFGKKAIQLVVPDAVTESEAPGRAKNAHAVLKTAQDWYTAHGFGPTEGNGKLPPLKFSDSLENAFYAGAAVSKKHPIPDWEVIVFGRTPPVKDASGAAAGAKELKGAKLPPDLPHDLKQLLGKMTAQGRPFEEAKDVIIHEYTHRITSHVIGRSMMAEGAATDLGEHVSDTMAKVILNDTSGILGGDVMPGGVRSMKDPGRMQDAINGHPLPAHVKDYMINAADQAGAHINVGIANKASQTMMETLGTEKVGEIYAHTLLDKARGHSAPSLHKWATWTVETARELDPSGEQAKVVAAAWKDRGVHPGSLISRIAEHVHL